MAVFLDFKRQTRHTHTTITVTCIPRKNTKRNLNSKKCHLVADPHRIKVKGSKHEQLPVDHRVMN